MKYETELDGVRALAVIGVLLFHLGLPFIPGGFIGVDIFFVLSGYLITALITRSMNAGTFSFKDFYIRRARRLLPALFVVINLCFVISFLLFSPDDFKAFCRSGWHAILSISNINFWLESGYFDSDKYTKPLLHTWSLGVEEQFYLFWPIALAGLALVNNSTLKKIILSVFILGGLGISFYLTFRITSAVFYLSPFRAWQFAAGGLLALFLHDHAGVSRAWVLPAPLAIGSTLVGLGLVSYGYFAISPANFPGKATLAATIATLLLILGGSTVFSRLILANPIARFLGKISYSLYLTHWPIIVFWRYYNNSTLTWIEMIIVAALSIGTAWLLYKFVETKYRAHSGIDTNASKSTVPTGLLAFAISLMIMCVLPWVQNGWPWRIATEKQDFVLAAAKSQGMDCNMRSLGNLGEQCFFGISKRKPDFVVIGDSHAAALSLGLEPIAKAEKMTGVRMVKPGTLPFMDGRIYDNGNPNGQEFDRYFRWIQRQDVDTIILHGRYAQNWETKNPIVKEQTTTKYIGRKDQPAPSNKEESQVYFVEALDRTLKMLKKSGKTVVLVGPVPYQGVDLAQCMNRPRWVMTTEHSIQVCSGFSKKQSLDRVAGVNVVLQDAAERAGVIWIDPTPTFCPDSKTNCLRIVDGIPLYKDDNHLNNYGAKILSELIFDELGWANDPQEPSEAK